MIYFILATISEHNFILYTYTKQEHKNYLYDLMYFVLNMAIKGNENSSAWNDVQINSKHDFKIYWWQFRSKFHIKNLIQYFFYHNPLSASKPPPPLTMHTQKNASNNNE